jgi:hypothetical protein
LPAKNVRQTINYYVNNLVFTRAFQDTPDDPPYAGVARDIIELHLQWHDSANFDATVEKSSLRFLIDGVDALHDEYKDRRVLHEKTAVRNTLWGTREFAFYDLFGSRLTFYRD